MPNNEFGDFQTPGELAAACVKLLHVPDNAVVIEPTCGFGSFLKAVADAAPHSDRHGLEINAEYAEQARQYGDVIQDDFFQFDLCRFSPDINQPLIIIGNPPWVTAADLKRMGSANIPAKENFKHAKGFDALLGSSNFDVCEYIILKLLGTYSGRPFKLGMLCKTQVARNAMEFAARNSLPIINSSIHRIDAKYWFNAGVDACWFMITSDPEKESSYITDVYDSIDYEASVVTRFGVVSGRMVSNVDAYKSYCDGDDKCPYEWRSGLKHDASKVFELKSESGMAVSSFGDQFEPDGKYVLPLMKSTDVFRGKPSTKYVIVPQRTFGGNDEQLRLENFAVWQYLDSHSDIIDSRKSSVYHNQGRFTVFGHGDYTYAPYKLATSGLHKDLMFRIIPPLNGVPVVLDDTSYFIPFDDPTEVCMVKALLDSPACVGLIRSLVFWDSKRPISKKLLARVNMFKVPRNDEEVLGNATEIANQLKLPFNHAKAKKILDMHSKHLTLF